MRSYILKEISSCIDKLLIRDFMKIHLYKIIFDAVFNDSLIIKEFGNEVDIPEFMKKDNILKFRKEKNNEV